MLNYEFDIKIGRYADGARRLIVYLRRSSDRQPNGIYVQLDWAIKLAAALGLQLNATREDLDHMVANNLHQHKDIYLDSGISGANLDRPGITAARIRAKTDKSIAAFLVHELDRSARPEIATEAMRRDQELLYAGISIITSRKSFPCRLHGRQYIGDDVTMLFEYYEAGDYLVKLATRLLEARIRVAKNGFRTGGRAPYGFKRVLVNERGEVVMELPDGMKVKQPGCHVQLRAADPLKIAVWLEVLHMYGMLDWGLQRIAGELNRRGIAPIAAGRKRKNGTPINRSGLWGDSSVAYLIDHTAIIAVAEFGREATGRHRRLSEKGAEELSKTDRDADGDPIRRDNPRELVIRAEGGYETLADRGLFEICRQKRIARRDEQANLRRAKDPAEFPLAGGLIVDANCGSSMHGQHKTSQYICGTYNKRRDSHGRKIADRCHHNTVDAEASLRFTMSALRQVNGQCGGREIVEKKLRELLTESNGQHDRSRFSEANIERLERDVSELQSQINVAEENLALEKDPKHRDAVRRVFDRKSNELEAKQAELEEARRTSPSPDETDFESKVTAAMAIYDRFDQVIETKPLTKELRIELQPMLKSLGFKLTCRFGAKLKGNRRVRAMLAGALTLGSRPVDPGDEIPNEDSNGPVGPTGLPDPDEDSGKEKSLTPKTAVSSGMGHNGLTFNGRHRADRLHFTKMLDAGPVHCSGWLFPRLQAATPRLRKQSVEPQSEVPAEC